MAVISLKRRAAPSTVDGAEPAAIQGELEELRRAIEAHRAEAAKLGAEWLKAGSQAEAERIEARRRECQRVAERDAARLPEIEARIAAAKAARVAGALARHRGALEAIYPRLRAAIEAAGAIQAEAIAARKAAFAELGQSVAEPHLPTIVFRGVLLPDLIALWARETDKIFEQPWRPPAAPAKAPPVGVSAVVPQPQREPQRLAQTGGAGAPSTKPAPPPPPPLWPPPRQSRRDGPPAAGERAVFILRGGMHAPDGKQLAPGDQANLPEQQALALVQRGVAEFVEADAAATAAALIVPAPGDGR